MKIELQSLPYKEDALKPAISERTVHIHYHGHHQSYVEKLNKELEKTRPGGNSEMNSVSASESLEEIILQSVGHVYNLAAQIWNHSFYWECLSPYEGSPVSDTLSRAIDNEMGGMELFHRQFIETASSTFGSGWTWLVKDENGSLQIINTHDGDNPLSNNLHPLLAIDMWEHAFYLDYQTQDTEYLSRIWKQIRWEFVSQNYETPFSDRLQTNAGKNLVRMVG